MIPYFSEYLPSASNNSYCNSIKFDIFEGLESPPNTKVIENRVHRGGNMNKNAFPDAVMIEAELDDCILNPLVNNFSLYVFHRYSKVNAYYFYYSRDRLANRIKCLKGIYANRYSPRIVYDLDYLYRNSQRSADIPQ